MPGGSSALQSTEAEDADEVLELDTGLGIDVEQGAGNILVDVRLGDGLRDGIDNLALRRADLERESGQGDAELGSDVGRDGVGRTRNWNQLLQFCTNGEGGLPALTRENADGYSDGVVRGGDLDLEHLQKNL